MMNFFAIDLGATSGRTILGTLENGRLTQRELTRFQNPIIQTCGHCHWDLLSLYREILEGLKLVAREGIAIQSIGIDTWGCDFALFGKDGGLLRQPYCYRDPHTEGAMEAFFERMPREKVYDKTGIQFMPFNSLFQLDTLRRNHDSAMEVADKILFIPDALIYMLTGEQVCEYTVLSTSQMLDPRTKRMDDELLQAICLDETRFGRYVQPGEQVGVLSDEVQRLTGLGAIPVVAVAGHDTGSAVAAVPAENERFAYLSCGTWSLLGIEVPDAIINEKSFAYNFTNEGGIEGTTRFLKNICGM
nr:rhamnulokinase [Bacteroidaceae bacterium]